MNRIYKRICTRCEKEYKTTSRMSKVCLDCSKQKGSNLREKYFLLKEELNQIRHNETLSKWKVLSQAYKIGKDIWGREFSVKRLAKDMEMPYTTVKRCLSLSKATPKTWTLIKQGKISAFKAAQICMTKSNKFQDETIKAVIENNYSTSKIKSWNIQYQGDLVLLRQKMAVEKGFARKDTAYNSLHNWIEKGRLLLLTKPECFRKEDLNKLKKELEYIERRIKIFKEGMNGT